MLLLLPDVVKPDRTCGFHADLMASADLRISRQKEQGALNNGLAGVPALVHQRVDQRAAADAIVLTHGDGVG